MLDAVKRASSTVVFLTMLAACGAPRTAAAPPPTNVPPSTAEEQASPSTPSPPEVASSSPAPRAGCRYEADEAQIRISPPDDEDAFTVSVSSATIFPASRADGSPEAEVDGRLRFTGFVTPTFFRTATPRELEGFGRIPAGLATTRFAAGAQGVLASVRLSWSPPRSRSPFAPEPTTWYLTLMLPELPCDAFAPYTAVEDPERVEMSGELVFGPEELRLRDAPDSDRWLHLLREGGVPLLPRDTRGTWTRVEVPSSEGASIAGWVESHLLTTRRPPSGEDYLIGALGNDPAPSGTRARARLRRGAPVFAVPGRGAWATVASDELFDVRVDGPESGWVLLEPVRDVRVVGWSEGRSESRGTQRAWVRREDVRELQPDRQPPDR